MSDLDRELWAVFNPPAVLDSAALAAATDLYEAETGDVNDLVFGAAVITYLEAARENQYNAQRRELDEAA